MRNLVIVAAAVLVVGLSWSALAEAGWCKGSGRTSASLAELTIRWQTVERISKGGDVVTGQAEGEESSEVTLRWGDRPIIVYVCDESAGCEGFDKLEEVVLKDEKVALAMKAFRTVKMHPEHAAEDPVTQGEGKAVPRMLLIEPADMKVKVLEKGKLKASALYKAMQKTAGKVYEEKLDKVVKAHLKLLTEQDKLANAEKVLAEKVARLKGEEGKGAARDLEKAEKEAAEVKGELAEVQKKQRELWKLTPRAKAS